MMVYDDLVFITLYTMLFIDFIMIDLQSQYGRTKVSCDIINKRKSKKISKNIIVCVDKRILKTLTTTNKLFFSFQSAMKEQTNK